MSQIKITILKEGSGSKKVLSCSFFTMQDAYRPVEKYQRNFMKFLTQTSYMTDFEIRVYTDDSAKDFLLEATKKITNVAVLHYDYPPLREKKGHIGIFGMFPRFLPMFEPGLDLVWISDIDLPDSFFDRKRLTLMDKHNVQFSFNTYICYNERKPYGRNYTILAGTIISKIIFPKAILTRFINKLSSSDIENDVKTLNDRNKYKPYSKVPYGIDEHFLNKSIYDYIKRHNFTVLTTKLFLISEGILIQAGLTQSELVFTRYYYARNPTKEHFNKLKQIIKKKLPSILSKYPCAQELLDKIDKLPVSMQQVIIVQADEL
jgi:hypothetical protein